MESIMIEHLEKMIKRSEEILESGLDSDGGKLSKTSIEFHKNSITMDKQAIETINIILDMDAKGTFKIDTLGHSFPRLKTRSGLEYFFSSSLSKLWGHMFEENVSFKEHLETGKLPTYNVNHRPMKEGSYYLGLYQYSCKLCGDDYFDVCYKDGVFELYKVDTKTFDTTRSTPCILAEAEKPYDIYIDIPSGEMILSNNVKGYDIFDKDCKDENGISEHSEYYSLCNAVGKQNFAVGYSAKGAIHLSISNCSCQMFQDGDTPDKFVMGSGLYGEEFDNMDMPENYKLVGDVCTDWWGYSVVDKDDFIKKFGSDIITKNKYQMDDYPDNQYTVKYSEADWGHDVHIIKCLAGRYKFTHRFRCRDKKDDTIYTYIERVGDCGGDLPLNYIGKPS
jgi:hypothetical protein